MEVVISAGLRIPASLFNSRSKKNDFLNKMSTKKKSKGVYEAVVDYSKEKKISFSI